MTLRMPQGLAVVLCLCGFAEAVQSSGVWLDVPFIKQEKNGCGAASVAMVMQYWQKQQGRAEDKDQGSDPATIQHLLYSRDAHGIYASDVERYFGQHGFRAFSFRGTWEDLKQHLEKGRPLIVALKPVPADVSLHYVVV